MRKTSSAVGALTVVFVVAVAAAATRQEGPVATDSGSEVFRTYCAVCHGTGGRGDGPLAEDLRVRPPDLALIAKRNAGRYPEDKVRRIIDGRTLVKGHGGADMPVWGDAFRRASDGYSEAKVKEKIDALVEYLRQIQIAAS
jgi:mono/diheme cytochrome c family protein